MLEPNTPPLRVSLLSVQIFCVFDSPTSESTQRPLGLAPPINISQPDYQNSPFLQINMIIVVISPLHYGSLPFLHSMPMERNQFHQVAHFSTLVFRQSKWRLSSKIINVDLPISAGPARHDSCPAPSKM